jgi:hypothetical protein
MKRIVCDIIQDRAERVNGMEVKCATKKGIKTLCLKSKQPNHYKREEHKTFILLRREFISILLEQNASAAGGVVYVKSF